MKRATMIALLFLAGPTAGAAVEIREFQAAHGRFGPRRENLDVFPGEEVLFRYQVKGVRTDALGRIDIDLEERVTAEDGRMVAHAKIPQRSRLALGGDSFTGHADYTFSGDTRPGGYRITLTVIDNIAGESATTETLLTVKPVAFAVVMPRFSHDAAGEIPAPASGLLGETLHASVKAIGLDASKDRLDAEMTLQIFDAQGKPTMPEPIVATFRQDDPKIARRVGLVRFKAEIGLNRVGEFTLKMAITDRVSGKTAAFTSALVVTAP